MSKSNITCEAFFLQKSYTKRGGETNSRPFSKKPNLSILLINSLKFQTVYFNCVSKLKAVPHIKLLKNKGRSGTSLPFPLCKLYPIN